MFERYTEKARRVIFFARYEASHFGSPYIESEHMLLGLLREDKALTNRFMANDAAVESIRNQIEEHVVVREKISTSVDLPLSNECKRILSYAAEEAERLAHQHIGTEHLLLGILREEECFAAEILDERGVRLPQVRATAATPALGDLQRAPISRKPAPPSPPERTIPTRFVDAATQEVLFAQEDSVPKLPIVGETLAVRNAGVDTDVIFRVQDVKWVYLRNPGLPTDAAAAQGRIDTIAGFMENAIANHEFEKARFYSEEERKDRANLRTVLDQYDTDQEGNIVSRKDSASFSTAPGKAQLLEIIVTLAPEKNPLS